MSNLNGYKFISKEFYNSIKTTLSEARNKVYQNICYEMVLTYWKIGQMIDELQGGEERAEYGANIIKELSLQLTKDFGKGFGKRNLFLMRKFYRTFKIVQTVSAKLSRSHYALLIQVS